jgi:release factor glutamine methyltransferase
MNATGSTQESWTIGRLLGWTAEYLAKQGADSPRLDAEILLAHARGCQRIELYTAFTDPASDELREKFRALVKQRAQGVPVAYLVGRREFYSLSFRVTRDVLIPRPETEFAVIEVLDRIGHRPAKAGGPAGPAGQPGSDSAPATERTLEIVDVGTGSGAIVIALAVHAPQCRFTAVDVSPAALRVARENAAEHGVAEQIEFQEGDLLSGVAAGRKFDVVVSNPPYVSEAEFAQLPRDVREHEPRVALLAGPTGVEVIARLAAQAAEHLVSGGWLICEISPMIAAQALELLAALGTYEPATIRKDLAGLARIVIARRR